MENQKQSLFNLLQMKIISLWGAIKTEKDALYLIRAMSLGFYLVSLNYFVIKYLIAGWVAAIGYSIFFAVLAFLLRKYNSKIAAIVLLLASVAILVTAGLNQLLSFSMVWTGICAVCATFSMDKYKQVEVIK
jgi:hypothetical protein